MKCYICNNASTSYEHVPASCFFPKDKRINLIKVPSCDLHNLKTSKDDEYIRNVVAMTKGANKIAVELFRSKGLRSLKRSPALESIIARNPKVMNFIKDDDTTKGLTYEVERVRFDRVMKKIAYGLHFHKYKITWEKGLNISTNKLILPSHEPDFYSPLIKRIFKIKETAIFEGDNPEVFQFAFFEIPIINERAVFMKFYEVFEIWAVPIKESTFATI